MRVGPIDEFHQANIFSNEALLSMSSTSSLILVLFSSPSSCNNFLMRLTGGRYRTKALDCFFEYFLRMLFGKHISDFGEIAWRSWCNEILLIWHRLKGIFRLLGPQKSANPSCSEENETGEDGGGAIWVSAGVLSDISYVFKFPKRFLSSSMRCNIKELSNASGLLSKLLRWPTRSKG